MILQEISNFSLWFDKTMAISNTAQLAIFIHGITADFDILEELLSLEAMYVTIGNEDLFERHTKEKS